MKLRISITVIIVIILSVATMILIPTKEASTNHTLVYTAIGDSIAEDPSAGNSHSYAYYIDQYLVSQNKNVSYYNFAKSGDTSSDLLNKLKTSSEVIEEIKSSDIITICIGGNNIIGGIEGVFSGNGDSQAQAFKNDWSQILQVIRNLNSKAAIYAMNIYNPVEIGDQFEGIELNTQLCDIIDKNIMEINNIIEDNITSNEFNYKVVDVYSFFKENQGGKKPMHGFRDNSDPHPTDFGHQMIANLHTALLK